MNILCIDTSTRQNWVGLYAHGVLTDCVGFVDRQSCLINLMPSVKMALDNAQISIASLDAVATVSGPGAWSSLRIGAATVKQLCLVNQLPLFAITNHDLIVETLLQGGLTHRNVLVTLDAQNKKVYSAQYRINNGEKTLVSGYQWEDASKIAYELSRNQDEMLIVGDGAHHFVSEQRANWHLLHWMPQSDSGYLKVLGALAEATTYFDREDILRFKPLYVQPSSAEIEFKVSIT